MSTTDTYVHLKDEDPISFRLQNRDTSEPYVSLDLGRHTTVFPTAATLVALRAACDAAIEDLRAAIVEQWNAEHPECPEATTIGGQCEGCRTFVDRLFTVTVPIGADGNERESLSVCQLCADVPADAALPVVGDDPEQPDAKDLRADLHDAGLDDEPAVVAF